MLESAQELGLSLMKKLAIFVLLSTLGVGCCLPVYAKTKTQNKYQPLNRDSRKAEKKQEKAQKKYAKAQKKAERKMLKTERKNSTYKPTKRF